jgi:hypothetical protein
MAMAMTKAEPPRAKPNRGSVVPPSTSKVDSREGADPLRLHSCRQEPGDISGGGAAPKQCYEIHACEMHACEIHAYEMQMTPIRYTPMRHMPVRCTPIRHMAMRCTPVRCTPVRYTPMKVFART